MTEIKRYKIEDGFLDLGVKGGLFVRDEDHAAIVAALQEQVRALAAEVSECRRFVAEELGTESGIQFAALSTERSDEVLREIRAQAIEGFVEFNRKLAKDYPMAMVAKALEVTELNGEQYAARIRAGEQR